MEEYLERQPALCGAFLIIFSISLYLKVFYVSIPLLVYASVIGFRRSLFRVVLPLFIGIGLLNLYYGGNLPKGEHEGKIEFHIEKVGYQAGFFGSSWSYSGTVRRFTFDEGTSRNLPFTYHRKGKLGPLDASSDYEVLGTLIEKDTYGYSLKVPAENEFKSTGKNQGLAQKRYEIKKSFKKLLNSKVPWRGAREFLIGLSTGDFSNSYLAFTFSRFGLNHLLAISGFHFGLLLLFLNVLLRPFLPFRLKTLFLICGLTAFYLFVGDTPSLSRAWIVASIYLVGAFLGKPSSPINTLSLSMCLILILDPMMLKHMGFQFSFLVTFGILLYTPKVHHILVKWGKPGSTLQKGVAQAIALGISVHIAAIPLTLYYFHKFYLMGFFFNLIVPVLVGAAIFLLLGALFLHVIFPLGAKPFFLLSGYLCENLLSFIYWVPTSLDYVLRVPLFPLPLLIGYLILFFVIGTFKRPHLEVGVVERNQVTI